MFHSWVSCLLFLGSVLLLGQATQGNVQFNAPLGSSHYLEMMRTSKLIWGKQYKMMYDQAIQVHQLALNYLNKKHNTTYFKAPGEITHIMVQTEHVRIYRIHTVVVNAKCPENHSDVNLNDCEIPPESPKLECEMDMMVPSGFDPPYMNDKGCHEFKAHPTPPDVPVSPSEEEEEATPYQ